MTTIREATALTVPSVDPLEMVRLAGVPETVVTVPLPKVADRKSKFNADAVIVKALDPTEAEIGWICGYVIAVVASVPVAAGNVSVKSLFVFGAAMVNVPVPLALPETFTKLMLLSLVQNVNRASVKCICAVDCGYAYSV
jgi:hypothetical protein